MKAAVLKQLHEPLVFEEVPTPTPENGEALIRLKAGALNHRDLWITKGLYPGVKVPVIMGSDGVGVVEQVGGGALEEWVGKEVIVNPAHNWGGAESHYGPDFRILGLEDNGTFAEYVKVPATYLALKPSHLSYAQAAALPLAGLTAWRSLVSRAAFTPGEKVLITGIGGGVALFVLQFAVAMGAEVWVTSGSEAKISQAISLGAKSGVVYHSGTWHKELMHKANASRQGYFDVVVDSAAGPGFQRLVDVAAPGGRICFYGGTLGNITDLVPARIFFKQLSILGSTMGSDADFKAMLDFVNQKQLVPVVDRIVDFNEIEAGMQHMERGDQFGKIVFKF